jgi:hypothetical protein
MVKGTINKYSSCWANMGGIKSWLPSLAWFLPLLNPLVAIIILLNFGPCSLNLLVKLFSSRLETSKPQMMMEAEPHTKDPLLVPRTL